MVNKEQETGNDVYGGVETLLGGLKTHKAYAKTRVTTNGGGMATALQNVVV
jgi:hypothetical protein